MKLYSLFPDYIFQPSDEQTKLVSELQLLRATRPVKVTKKRKAKKKKATVSITQTQYKKLQEMGLV